MKPSRVEEDLVNGETPDEHVRRLALAKAMEVAQGNPGVWVLGADTIVVIDGNILGKPQNEGEAHTMLATLAARTHEVFTAYALVRTGCQGTHKVRSLRSEVHIRDLTAEEIRAYVGTGEPMDKAGAYAIQGIGSSIVERISGSYTNVVGLPLCEVMQDLKDLGIFDFLAGNRRA